MLAAAVINKKNRSAVKMGCSSLSICNRALNVWLALAINLKKKMVSSKNGGQEFIDIILWLALAIN